MRTTLTIDGSFDKKHHGGAKHSARREFPLERTELIVTHDTGIALATLNEYALVRRISAIHR